MILFNKMKQLFKRKQTNSAEATETSQPLHSHVEQNLKEIEQALGNPPDLIIRRFHVEKSNKNAAIVTIDGMVDKNLIEQGIIKPIFEKSEDIPITISSLEKSLLLSQDIKKVSSITKLFQPLLIGHAILLLEGETEALLINLIGFESRDVEESKTEATVRGAHEGFTEQLAVNLTMVRRRITNPKLRIESYTKGKETNTIISIFYVKDFADESILSELRKRIERITTEKVLDSGTIEQLIEDAPSSIFPTVGNTERPDRFAAKLLEGRIGIIVDGSPNSLTIPYLFIEGFQSHEDYYSRPFYSSVIRIFRFLAFFLGTTLPAIYVATQNFHKEMIPSELLASIAAARQGVPFPLILEIIMMLIVFDLLREAGVRMPRAVGQAISIVGALILGDAAVQAGIVGTPTIIVVAVTGITTFIVNPFADAISLLRYLLIIPVFILGMYGFVLGYLALIVHLSSLRSFGVPYLSPISPRIFSDWRDTFVRLSLRKLEKPPESIPQQRELRYKELMDLRKDDSDQ